MDQKNLQLLEIVTSALYIYVLYDGYNKKKISRELHYCADILMAVTLFVLISNPASQNKNILGAALIWLALNYVCGLNKNATLWYAYTGFTLSLVLSDLDKKMN